jgi:hypothetical protein
MGGGHNMTQGQLGRALNIEICFLAPSSTQRLNFLHLMIIKLIKI